MTLAHVPARPVIVVYSRIANTLVVRESLPPAPAILALHMVGRFVASFVGAGLITLGLAFLIGAFR